tara:strand:+ start:2666 stop:4381 length:1716 start_codon:yes stop_codon:yes gene_type:complete
MAEKIISPGVFTRENDFSFVSQGVAEIGGALVGPTVKGPVEVPTMITSYSEFENIFGGSFESGSSSHEFITNLAAEEYLKHSDTLTVVRVSNGAYTAATASVSASVNSNPSFKIKTVGEGVVMNSGVHGHADTEGAGHILVDGTPNNVRWETSSRNLSKGTFTLTIRRGDDSKAKKQILEQFINVGLDPNQSNYIGKIVGTQYASYDSSGKYVKYLGSYPNRSNYVYIDEASILDTNNWYDADGGVRLATASGSIPADGSGSFAAATGAHPNGAKMNENISAASAQGLAVGDYTVAFELLSNTDEYDINMVMAPGINDTDHAGATAKMMAMAENRGDCIALVDPVPFGSTPATAAAVSEAENNSYAAMYWPWVQINSARTGKNVWVPATTCIGGVLAFNDSVSAEWFAPAGLNRGGISSAIRAERKLARADRDVMYEARLNPLATFPGEGVVVWGQKTLQKRTTALDRVNVRRLLINLKKFIASTSKYLVFENNTDATRQRFLAAVNPYMESVQQNQGLFAFKVIMDDTNNTADVIDRNIMKGDIYIQPAKAAEFIVVDFNIMPTGATFGE